MTSTVTYDWKTGTRYKADPEAAAQEFERIRQKLGYLTSEAVVDAARPKKSPLHNDFEWNDSVAAETYRRHQAASMIRAIVTVTSEYTEPAREYVLVKDANTPTGTSYQPIKLVLQDVDLFRDAHARLQTEVRQAQNSVDELIRIARSQKVDKKITSKIEAASKHISSAREVLSTL